MRIPRFQSGGLPGAEQQSVGAIISAGRAKMHGGLSTLNKVVDEFGSRILKEEADAELHRIGRDMKNQATAMTEELYKRDRVDDKGDPTHGTMESDFSEKFNSMREGFMDRIKHRGNESALTVEFGRLQDSFSAQVRGEVRKRQIDNLKAGDMEHLSTLMQDSIGGLDQANEFFNQAEISNRYSETDLFKMKTSFGKDWFTNKVMTEFQTAMDQSLANATDYAKGVAYPAEFNQEDINRLDNHMQGYISRELAQVERDKNVAERAATTADNKAWAHTSPVVSTALTGQRMTNSALDKIQAYIDDPNSDQFRVAEAKKAIAVNQETSVLFSMTKSAREARIVELMSQPLDSEEQRVTRDVVVRLSNQMDAAIQSDPYQAYVLYGGGTAREGSLSDAHKAGNLSETLMTQIEHRAEVAAWVGSAIPALSDKDVIELTKIGPAAFPEVLEAWGREGAQKVLSEVYKKGAKEMAFAGSLALQHDGGGAWKTYLHGVSISGGEKGGAYLPSGQGAEENADEVFSNQVAGIFPGDANFLNGIQEVADKIYASLSDQAQDRSGNFSEDRYREAVTAALGGIMTVGDGKHESKIVPPSRNMTAETFSSKLKELKMVDIDRMGGFKPFGVSREVYAIAGYSETEVVQIEQKELLDDLRVGKAKLHMTSKRGVYYVTINGMKIANTAGQPFQLDFSQE